LPALQDAAPPVAVKRTRIVPGAPLRIVVIEDNTDAAETLVMWLEGLGHTVKLATTGPSGLELIRSARPDLVLCDVGLPGMDGVEVCRQVRSLTDDKHLVMVALTGWGMESDRRRTGEAGFDHHLVKPVALDKLRDILVTVRAS
jgi:CheY-like chemotaxis protein